MNAKEISRYNHKNERVPEITLNLPLFHTIILTDLVNGFALRSARTMLMHAIHRDKTAPTLFGISFIDRS